MKFLISIDFELAKELCVNWREFITEERDDDGTASYIIRPPAELRRSLTTNELYFTEYTGQGDIHSRKAETK